MKQDDSTISQGQKGLPLAGKTVVITIAEGSHDHEFWYPYYRFLEEGAEVIVAGVTKGVFRCEGLNGKDGLFAAEATHTICELIGKKIDCLFIPGGLYGPMALRNYEPMLQLVRSAVCGGVIVAAICHASWVLASAGVISGRRISCPEDQSVDITNAGGIYTKEKSVRDGNIVTAEYFGNMPEMFRILMPMFGEK
jgi:protease I